MRRLWIVLLLTGCFGPIHALQAERVARGMKPGCEKANAEIAPDNGWLWRTEACGEFFGCGYDNHGDMKCAAWPNRPITDSHLLKAADPAKMCRLLVGHPEGDHLWEINVCGERLSCAETDGFFECKPSPLTASP